MDKLAKLDAKYVLLSAPVGSGKSKIGMAAAKGAGSAFIVSPQNILLDQYARDFDDVPMVKGMSHYTCSWAGRDDLRGRKPSKSRSTQDGVGITSRPGMRFGESPISVTNLHFAMFAHPPKGAIHHRDLLVVDECHGLEPMLLDLFHAKVLRKDCAALGVIFDSPDSALMFLEYIQKAAHVRDEDGDFVRPGDCILSTQTRREADSQHGKAA